MIAGRGRVLAAERLAPTEAPVIVLGHLTEDQRRAYRIADNRLTEPGGWDEEILAREFRELIAADLDVSLTGFGDDQMDAMLRALEDDGGDGEEGDDGDAGAAEDGAAGAAPAATQPWPTGSGSRRSRFSTPARAGGRSARRRGWHSEFGRGESPAGGAPMPLARAKAGSQVGRRKEG